MARYTGPVCRLCRREGEKLYLKGERCLTEKCSVDRRTYPPGQHGRGRIKQSEYLLQLREKQKAKRYYRLAEKQFRGYYEKASAQRGVTGENLLRLLEMRLDNVVYRLGLAVSRNEARLLIGQGHFVVNGRRVTIPSYQVRTGDVVGIGQKAKATERVRDATEQISTVAGWLQADHENLKGTVLRVPERNDIDTPVQEQLIVELYSK